MAGLITVTLQIAYLPHLYAAFNRRENEIALLNSRAGMPSWGPELLARTHYALGSGTSALNTLPEFYTQLERWAADVTESHVTPGRSDPAVPAQRDGVLRRGGPLHGPRDAGRAGPDDGITATTSSSTPSPG
jgi:hypothetical protein